MIQSFTEFLMEYAMLKERDVKSIIPNGSGNIPPPADHNNGPGGSPNYYPQMRDHLIKHGWYPVHEHNGPGGQGGLWRHKHYGGLGEGKPKGKRGRHKLDSFHEINAHYDKTNSHNEWEHRHRGNYNKENEFWNERGRGVHHTTLAFHLSKFHRENDK